MQRLVDTARSRSSQPTPAWALMVSGLALIVPVTASMLAPMDGPTLALAVWLLGLMPCFLLPYFSGWRGALLAFGGVFLALLVAQAGLMALQRPFLPWGVVSTVATVVLAVALGTGWVAESLRRERARAEEEPPNDVLTGLPKRRHAVVFLEAAWGRAVRGEHLAVVLFDVDGLKDINDRHGPAAGDRVLRSLGNILSARTRRMDASARFGGGSFVSVLVGCPIEQAEGFAEYVLKRMADTDFGWGPVTISAGVSAIEEGMGSPDILLAAADRALFAAKEQGGDRVCRADRPRRAPPIPRPVPTPTPLRDLTGLRALVVDDDPATLGSTGRLLTRMGCVVTTVESVGDALRVLTGPEEVDVLLTDIVMPEMSGFTLVDVATRVRPNLAVLYMSGHPHEEVYWGGSPGACSSFLAKPMEVDELRAALIDLLEVAPDVDGVGRDTPAPEPGATAVAAAEAEPPQPSPVNILPPPRINGKILIVDDDSLVVQALQRLFLRAGYAEPIGLTDSREVREVLESESVDLLILDLHMPELDGFQMLAALATWIPPEEYLPVLALTADSDPTVRRRALAAGAMDFLSKPFDPAEAEARARNLLETRFLTLRVAEQRDTLEHRVLARTSELADTRTEILHRLARAAEYRDDVTGRHADRVGMLSSRLAEEIGLPPMEVDLIRRTAPLHDIGKIGVPDAVLRKPGQLTPTEYELMKTHTTIGAQILGGSRHRILQLAAEIAGSHHERWDGAGYPRGIAGEAIPLAARIVTVADTFDTIAHTRPYQDARALEAAVEEIIRCADSHFDPKVVEAFQAIIRRVGLDGLHELSDPIEPLRDTTDSGAATPSTW